MRESIVGKKNNSAVYIPTEARIRLLVTADCFKAGGTLSNEQDFEKSIRQAVVEHLTPLIGKPVSTQDGVLSIDTVAVGEFEPAR